MIRRCNNPNDSGYPTYGARGIRVCNEWIDIHNFVTDMYPSYEDGLTLERKDVLGNYCKENCIWISLADQQKNKRCYRSNSTGVAGTSIYTNDRGTVFVKARFQSNKIRRVRLWSINKYGLEKALELAKEWLGYNYRNSNFGEKHGVAD
jgi:hypothetical protein